MSQYDELLARLDAVYAVSPNGALLDDAAAAIRELEAKLEAALAPERTAAGQQPWLIRTCNHEWFEGRCVHCNVKAVDGRAAPASPLPPGLERASLTHNPTHGAARLDSWIFCCVERDAIRTDIKEREMSEPTPSRYPVEQGTWTLISPSCKIWEASSPLRCLAAEANERIPANVQLQRIKEAMEPTEDERTLSAQRTALLALAERIRREGMQGVANQIEEIVK